MYKLFSAAVILLLIKLPAFSQSDFYFTNSIQEVRIYFKESNWQQILDSLFQSDNNESRLSGDVMINGTKIRGAGIRWKGYSSYNAGKLKNSFNIDLEYSFNDRNYQGYKKLKLNNVIHDPSFIREVLAYEIARKYMPASKANYANVFVNDKLIGIYTNVEDLSKDFLSNNFQSEDNVFIKGEPKVLIYPYGQNANLAKTHGDSVENYIEYYKLQSDTGWNALFELISVLNENTDSIENILNVDRALWMHAFNYSLVNLDSYIAYAQNYYLYLDNHRRFNPLVWDLNMSFGSFRLSDASNHFSGLTINQLKQLDPLQHATFSISPRPLMTKLFKNQTYKRMYLAHLRTIIENEFASDKYFNRAQEIHHLIQNSVVADTCKFYSDSDFYNNLYSTVGGFGGMIQYPGIKDLMDARIYYLKNYPGYSGFPIIDHIESFPESPSKNDSVHFRIHVSGAQKVFLMYRFAVHGKFEKIVLFDNGLYPDSFAIDNIFCASVSIKGNLMQYYVYAENNVAGVFAPEKAENEFFTIYTKLKNGDLVINEINTGGDNYTEPWIELYNTTKDEIFVSEYFLSSDNLDLKKYKIPNTIINSKSYLVLNSFQKDCATKDFGFPNSLGFTRLYFSDSSENILDSIGYVSVSQSKSIGRFPNGYGNFVYMTPSKGEMNNPVFIPQLDFIVYPNPAKDKIYIERQNTNSQFTLQIFDLSGKKLYNNTVNYENISNTSICHEIDVSRLKPDIYIVKIISNNLTLQKKIVVF